MRCQPSISGGLCRSAESRRWRGRVDLSSQGTQNGSSVGRLCQRSIGSGHARCRSATACSKTRGRVWHNYRYFGPVCLSTVLSSLPHQSCKSCWCWSLCAPSTDSSSISIRVWWRGFREALRGGLILEQFHASLCFCDLNHQFFEFLFLRAFIWGCVHRRKKPNLRWYIFLSVD